MEKLGDQEIRGQQQRGADRRKRSKAETPIMIKYISSPMMVQANNASEFRAIVQELTGQYSDATFPDHGTTYCEQPSKADMKSENIDELMNFSDDNHVLDFGQFDEVKFWREVAESLCLSEYSPYVYA